MANEHEIGDKSVHVSIEDVKKAYLEIGAQPGDTLLMHGSLSSMGTVDGGVKSVFDGMLLAASPDATIAMPTLWFAGHGKGMYEKDFDVDHSIAYNGALAEGLRQDPRSIRSNHFSHAVSAIGARAVELTRNHGASGPRPSPWTERAFALSSPWTRLIEWNALYTFIGVSMNVCTLKHWIEGEIVLSYLNRLPEGERQSARDELLSMEHRDCPWPWINMIKLQSEIEEAGILKKTKLGSATLRGVRTRPLVSYAMRRVLSAPAEFIPSEAFLQWAERHGNCVR